MSGLLALAKPRRIKASHRRRGKVASGPIVQRYYDPAIGRFLSVDPVTAYSNPVGAFNRYWYANNNPYKFTDPDGRESACFSTGYGCGLRPTTAEDKAKIGVAMTGLTAMVTAPFAALGAVRVGMAALANPGAVAAATDIAAGAAGVTGTAGGLAPVLKGQAGVAQSVAAATARGEQILGKEITLTAGKVTTRPDLLVRKADGALKFIESKCGGGACLTPNQRSGFPVIEAGGAVPRGGNAAAAGLQPGKPLPPTEVQIDWWP